jgi:hypothetical protein
MFGFSAELCAVLATRHIKGDGQKRKSGAAARPSVRRMGASMDQRALAVAMRATTRRVGSNQFATRELERGSQIAERGSLSEGVLEPRSSFAEPRSGPPLSHAELAHSENLPLTAVKSALALVRYGTQVEISAVADSRAKLRAMADMARRRAKASKLSPKEIRERELAKAGGVTARLAGCAVYDSKGRRFDPVAAKVVRPDFKRRKP